LIDVGRDQAREFLNRLKDRAGLLWKRDLKMSTFIPVFRVRRDSLVVASGNQGSRTSVYGLNARDGSILWEQRTGGHVALSQIMADGSVIGISQEDPDKTVAAWRLNMENGQRIWTRAIASPVKGAAYWFSEPLLLCDRAYMAVNRWKGRETVSQYLCLDLDGNVLWQQSESTALSPLADAGYRNLGAGTDALVVGWKDTLRAYNLDSGKVLWTETLPSSSVPDFVTDGNLLFFRTMDHQANAFDIATCRLLWRCPLPDARRSLPKSRIYSEAANCLGDNRMLTWDNEKLYMLSVTKGATREAPIWTYPLPKPLVTPPRIKDGAVYALLSDNTLLALDAGSGKERLRRSLLWKAQNFDVAGDVVFLLSEDSDL
ncbi:MAG: PQQ-binding-like beta-propeller repeat protein, partial [Deltaproteobacteria bacterium]|nr:PQQ-binding-like beta-propeller repeat protein [Deltaproteobacteria bacterium]